MHQDPPSRSIIDLISFPSDSNITECCCQTPLDQEYYQSQRKLIQNTKLTLPNAQERDWLMIELLNHLLRYVDKVDQLSSRECSCKKDRQLKNLRSSYQFAKKENDKLFELLEQKNQQCQKLKRELSKHESTIVEESRLATAHEQFQIGGHSKYFRVPLRDFSDRFRNKRS